MPDSIHDGINLSPLLFEGRELPERPLIYYRGTEIFACRIGDWKAHLRTQPGFGQPKAQSHEPPLLFHLGLDPSEKFDVAGQHPDVIDKIKQAIEAHQATVEPAIPQLQ